tara:strand:+ start:4809 stop:5591 length:783 start_codon:yes stop_codon:yes gene_type:complete
MSDFTSKIINWNNFEFKNIHWPSNTAFQDIFGFIIGLAQERKFLKVLDLGCGDGGQWNWYLNNQQDFEFDLEIIGFEPYSNNATPAGISNSDIMKIYNNLEDCNSNFDVVVCMSVLEHVYDRKNFLKNCYKFTKSSGYALINFDNGHFFNPREWKRNIFGKFLAKRTFIKKYYQDFVDVEEIISIALSLGLSVDHYIDYHLFIQKQRLKLISLCDREVRGKLLQKIQDFEKEVSDIVNAKDNKKIHNKFIYSSTLVLKKT